MHVLDECPDLATRLLDGLFEANGSVVGESLGEDAHERTVSGEEYAEVALVESPLWTMFRPARVFPAPGTPVTKQSV